MRQFNSWSENPIEGISVAHTRVFVWYTFSRVFHKSPRELQVCVSALQTPQLFTNSQRNSRIPWFRRGAILDSRLRTERRRISVTDFTRTVTANVNACHNASDEPSRTFRCLHSYCQQHGCRLQNAICSVNEATCIFGIFSRASKAAPSCWIETNLISCEDICFHIIIFPGCSYIFHVSFWLWALW